ncbi:MAG: hypothetical protein KC502_22345 [Myxococcales bacterium]|nr:hypothetical protein [Myxococcales bacterium]
MLTPYNVISDEPVEPFEFVPVTPSPDAPTLPPSVAGRILVDVIHDGAHIPAQFQVDDRGHPIAFEQYRSAYWLERDWGACLVAEAVCRHLGVPGYYRINIARVLMDFGRFPGLTQKDADHLDRYAINYPFSELLGFQQKRLVLQDLYDKISVGVDRAVRGTITKIAIHTYDKLNRSGTPRPEVSICTQPDSYNADSELPFGVFDPLYPDVLAEYTADRILRDRISLTFEKSGYRAAHNYPYTLPDGSIEVRSQVWAFFRFLRRKFEDEHPDTALQTGYELAWKMLCDTNLRSTTSEALRSYLYMYRKPPPGQEGEFAAAQRAYQHIQRFLMKDHTELVIGYRKSPERLSSLGLEVRKDLVYKFDRTGRVPLEPKPDAADKVGKVLAQAIYTYLSSDKGLVDS